MELKVMKKQVCQSKIVFNRSAEQSIDIDFTLPDYYPPINKVLKCKTTPRINSATIGGQTVLCDGTLNVLLMYVSDENEICSYEHIMAFNKRFEADCDIVGCMPECSVQEEYINCRATGERKVEVHGALGIKVNVKKQCDEQVICDIDGCNVVVNRSVAPATNLLGMSEKYLTIEEDLELGNSQPSVKYILRYDAKIIGVECKAISGKIVAKGDMSITVLYCAQGSMLPQCLKTNLPFSQIIDVDGVGDDCECSCSVEVAALEVKPRTSITGETRNMTLTAKLRFCAKATCDNDIPVIVDAFSTKYNADIVQSDMLFEKIVKTVSDKCIAKGKLQMNSGGINSVLDLWCDAKILACSVDNEQVKVSGEVNACMIICDNDNNPQYLEKSFDFEYTHPFKNEQSDIYCEAVAAVGKISYTIVSGNCLELTAELSINATVLSRQPLKLVTGIKVDENEKKDVKRDCAMIIYYAADGEKIWDIARKYNSSPIEICEINNIDGEMIQEIKPLLIPLK